MVHPRSSSPIYSTYFMTAPLISIDFLLYFQGKEISTVQTLKPQLVFFSNINLSGKRLVGFTSKTVNVASLQACFEECSKMKPLHCKSLNYKTVNNGHASTHSCELNTKKKEHDVSNNFNFDREYIYYEVLA